MSATKIDTGTEHLLASLDDGVLTLTLNRPEARNAMTREMNTALQQQLAAAELELPKFERAFPAADGRERSQGEDRSPARIFIGLSLA